MNKEEVKIPNAVAFGTFGADGGTSRPAGRATAVAACHRQAAKSRLSSPTLEHSAIAVKTKEEYLSILLFLVQMVGLEPTRPCEH